MLKNKVEATEKDIEEAHEAYMAGEFIIECRKESGQEQSSLYISGDKPSVLCGITHILGNLVTRKLVDQEDLAMMCALALMKNEEEK